MILNLNYRHHFFDEDSALFIELNSLILFENSSCWPLLTGVYIPWLSLNGMDFLLVFSLLINLL